MSMRKIKSKIFIVLFLFTGIFNMFAQEQLESTVVSIYITYQHWDQNNPWQKFSPASIVFSGTVLEGNIILTRAQPLSDFTMIQLSKKGESRKYPGKIILKDIRSNLALITTEDQSFFSDLKPARLAVSGIPEDSCESAGWEYGTVFKTYGADYLKTYVKYYGYNGVSLCFKMSSENAGGESGEPVFDKKGSLVGIVGGQFTSDKAVEVITSDMIRRFLTDRGDGTYTGIPFVWIEAAPLVGDNTLKSYLNLSPADSGLYIERLPEKGTAGDLLLPGDVLLTVDGIKIDDNGNYIDPLYGKLGYSALFFLNHQVGDQVVLGIARNGIKQELSARLLPVTDDKFLVPPTNDDSQPAYLLWGGLLFQELTLDYLVSQGKNWRQDADTRLIHYFNYYQVYPTKNRNRLVLMSKVFPDPFNQGYQRLRNQILEKVNGITVKNLEQLYDLLGSTSEEYCVFTFIGGQTVVLSVKEAEDATLRIQKQYSISAASSGL